MEYAEEVVHVDLNNIFSKFSKPYFLDLFFKDYDVQKYIDMVEEINSEREYSDTLAECGYNEELIQEMNEETEEKLDDFISYVDFGILEDLNIYVYDSFFCYQSSLVKDLSMVDGKRKYVWKNFVEDEFSPFKFNDVFSYLEKNVAKVKY